MRKLSHAEKLERFPPVTIRLLARRVARKVGAPRVFVVTAMSDLEVARAGGLTLAEVRRLSRLTSWAHETHEAQQAFCRGCGADLDSRDWLRKNSAYMQVVRAHPRYLRASPHWHSTFEPLIAIAATA